MASPLETNKTNSTPRSTVSQFATGDVDTVEIKVTIRPDQELRAARAMQIHEDTARVRVLYFYDTPDLALLEAGVVLRARLLNNGDDDSSVKIRPVDPGRIDTSWTLFEGFKLEADCIGDEVFCSASLTVLQKPGEIDDVADGKRPIDRLFSREQERFLGQHHDAQVDFSRLHVLGPIRVLRWQLQYKDLPHELTVEEWRLPDGDDLVEISIRVPAHQAATARREFEEHLNMLGLDPHGQQDTKTRAALMFFTRDIAAASS